MRPTLAIAAPVLAALLYVGARPVGPLPALGSFLDPANGIWGSARTAELPRNAEASIAGLGADVRVRYDDRGVPHIFATTEADAYRALGYVVARDRLMQLELQTRATAGTLSEFVGPATTQADIRARRTGLAWGAERRWAALDKTTEAAKGLQAYADGVNAWINTMSPAERPVEFKLLGKTPSRWEPKYSLYLFSRMSLTLAYDEPEVRRARVQAMVGAAAAEALFPVDGVIQEPIQPNGQREPRYDIRPVPPPGSPDSSALRGSRVVAGIEGLRLTRDVLEGGDAVGSNNWAVSPARTKSGHALLAGDPHLELTLPSIWYEVHLVVPGKIDVYGVTIPGIPGVIIGFNRDVAWTFTNTGADVLDFYTETVDDSTHPSKYLLDGTWQPLERRVETFSGRRGERVATDTMYYSHRGPMRKVAGGWLSMHWTALDSGGTTAHLQTFSDASRATSVQDFFKAMSPYAVPAQNMMVADRGGHIGIRSTGLYPMRPGDGRGDHVRDGTSRSSDWTGFWPLDKYPQAIDPAQGYLASANQQPVDPKVNPTYLGADWPAPWRALRINSLLRADSAVTPDAMRRYQIDQTAERANAFVPAFLAAADKSIASGSGDSTLARAARLLREWDRKYDRNNTRAVLFDQAMNQLNARLWDELTPRGDSAGKPRRRVATPNPEVVVELLRDSTNVWWDDHRTPIVEDRDALLVASLVAGLQETETKYGAEATTRWRWGAVNPRQFYHLLRIPSLSMTNMETDGGIGTLSPLDADGTHGASWRMVVELGPEVKAHVIYPGGQSGNPASSRYANHIPAWIAGQLEEPLVPAKPEALDASRVASDLTLHPRR